MSQIFKNGYALLIGVDESSVPDWSLPVVAKDVAALENVLTHPERCAYPLENVRKITGPNATRNGILDGLDWLRGCLQQDTSGNSTAIIFYSGHGWRSAPPGAPEFFLIPYDIRSNFIKSSGLRAEDFATAVEAIKPERLLVVIDSCHAAGMAAKEVATREGEAKTILPAGFAIGTMPFSMLLGGNEAPARKSALRGIGVLSRGHGRAVLNSSTSDQQSYIRRDGTMSIFTYHLIEALTGHAQPQEGATEVLVSDVMGHVSRRVPESTRKEHGKKQDPEFQISGGNFPIAMLLGGKGLSKREPAPDPLESLEQKTSHTSYQAKPNGSGAITQDSGAVAIGQRQQSNHQHR